MLRIAICDDDIDFLKKLKNYLYSTLKNKIIVYEYLNGYDLLEEINSFDFLFLDYQMPQLNGIEILEKLSGSSTKKIMITNFDYIVFDTYKYELYWFIRKQCFEKDMVELIKKINITSDTINKKLLINSSNKSISIPFSEINYILTDHNYILIYTPKQTYKIRSTFKSITKQFDNSSFITPTNGIIVNMNYIKYIDFKNLYIMMYNDKNINISRSKKNEVKEKYGKFNI